jgi:hypothetical protein
MSTARTPRRAALAAAVAVAAPIGVAGATVAPTRPPFASRISSVSLATLGGTWHPGCPVGPSSLRELSLSYIGFDGRTHTGHLVVAASIAPQAVAVFHTLYLSRFPIRMMVPESSFGGSDPRSMANDNTSGFNCRYAVGAPAHTWSVHAFGEAIDVNPVENPYLVGGAADPPQGAPYLRRTPPRPGMATADGVLVRAFASVGWKWGGRWTASPDYQHFSATGG